ncbi:class I SAM-dependent methyltransferase [Acetobacter orientalis]|uniref:class I SAM-dependent methyltransferase n=1 Tax=Acetobacter orientalis TaxID=146474 RepID=UPI0039E775CE
MSDVMPTTVPDFYQTQAGAYCAALLRERLQWFWPEMKHQKVLGLGYAAPCLGAWQSRGALCFTALLPECVGAVGGTAFGGPERAVVAEAAHLPFQDEVFDRIVVMHAFRSEAQAITVLRGAGRVLRDDGRMILIGPSIFAGRLRQCKTPFAHDSAFAPTTFRRVLAQAMLQAERRDEALFLPAQWGGGSVRRGRAGDIAGKVLAPGLGSIALVEVVKNIYAPRPLPITPWRRLWRRQPLMAELHAEHPAKRKQS